MLVYLQYVYLCEVFLGKNIDVCIWVLYVCVYSMCVYLCFCVTEPSPAPQTLV